MIYRLDNCFKPKIKFYQKKKIKIRTLNIYTGANLNSFIQISILYIDG